MHKDGLDKFAIDLLREHFKYNTSPVITTARWGDNELHSLTIAGIVGNEVLIVNSILDQVTWQPIENLSKYSKNNTTFELVFFGNKENQNSKHDGLYLASFSDQYSLEKAKANLLRFARGDFNIRSAMSD